jgi:pentatricopeptide repeat protein
MCEEGVKLGDVTFICLLSACSHTGLVDGGMCCYASMRSVYMISAKLEHYICMVDLLGCAGHLQDAENMIKVIACKPPVAIDRFSGCLQNSL